MLFKGAWYKRLRFLEELILDLTLGVNDGSWAR
jgi:hypothetical protein